MCSVYINEAKSNGYQKKVMAIFLILPVYKFPVTFYVFRTKNGNAISLY